MGRKTCTDVCEALREMLGIEEFPKDDQTGHENILDALRGSEIVPKPNERLVTDEKPEDEVELNASGYEWTCPGCQTLNVEMEIPTSLKVKCRSCGNLYGVEDYHHATG
jgi:hypothetical protein